MADLALVVRPARLEDVPGLEAIATEAGLAFQAVLELDRPFVVVLVAGLADEVVGFLSLQLTADEAEILDLGVLGAYRRRGIGKLLLERARAIAEEQGVLQLFLEVRRTNLAAVALYRACAFSQVGERKRYYRDGEDALLFRLLLGSTT
jgi:[ribosomal protein S18]-alanine N-acetyltransferase